MIVDDIKNLESGYNACLQIKSEEDLLVADEVTGEKTYAPCTASDVREFSRESKHLQNEIEHTIEMLKWYVRKRASVSQFFYLYQNLAEQTEDYLREIHRLHKKVYISIYENYDDEIMKIYTEELEPVLKNFLKLEINRLQGDWIADVADVNLPPSIKEIHGQCKMGETENGYICYEEFEPFYKKYVLTGLGLAMKKTLESIKIIETDISFLYRTRMFRDKQEVLFIYRYIKKDFENNQLAEHLRHLEHKTKRYFEDRVMKINVDSLRKQLDDTEDTYKNYTIYQLWKEHDEKNETEMEEFAYELNRHPTSHAELEKLFEFQGERNWLKNKIQELQNIEEHGDPFFAEWIDPDKLEEYLKYWIKAEINTQEKWYIVWCLMKYTFNMVKKGQDKNNFASRMNLMFPKLEKPCILGSFRKQETKQNHNQHFQEWLSSDKDYPIAQKLYEKLKVKEKYSKEFYL